MKTDITQGTRQELADEMYDLLKEVLNSDMAMREEDEGRKSPVLKKIRKLLKRIL